MATICFEVPCIETMSALHVASCSSMTQGLGVVISMCLCDEGAKTKHFNSVMAFPSQVPINANTAHVV